MEHLILLLAIFQAINPMPSVATVEDNICNEVCNCSSNKKISCSPGIEILLRDRIDFVVRCLLPHANLSFVFNGLYIIADQHRSVKIEGCTLPNSSLSDLLGSIGVKDFDKLHIASYNGSLQRKHFQNLDKVSKLEVYRSDLGVLPVDTFEGLTDLKSLLISLSSFKLTKNMFRGNTNPFQVVLFKNNISEVSFDCFNSSLGLNSLTVVGENNTSVIFKKSNQYVTALSYLRLQSVRLTTQLNDLVSADGETKTPSPERTTNNLPIQLREIILQSSETVEIVIGDNTANTFLLQSRCFAELPNLSSIELTASNLKFVPEDAFSKSINIHTVLLSNNLINTFHEKTFSDLENLIRLDLSKNQISHLPEWLFSRTKKLNALDVSYNLLKHIEQHLFSHLTELEFLDLSYNNIIFISGEQFVQLHNVKSIDLSHNQLMSLALDPLLRDLDYSVFYNCTELENLHLQHNSLKEIYEDWRLEPTRLYRIKLDSNNITDIQSLEHSYDILSARDKSKKKTKWFNKHEDNLFFWEKNFQIEISSKALNCNCDLLTSFYHLSQNFTRENILLSRFKCWAPKVFQNVQMIKLNLTIEYEKCEQLPPDENQKFHQGCPKGCRCVYRPLTKSSVINCQNAGLQDYPRTLPVAPGADHTELTLYGNRLREFSLPDDPGYKNVTFLNLANNLLTTLDINGVSKKLKKLDLRHNQLKTLSVETLELLEDALELERLELHNNIWSCDISNYRLAQLVYNKQHLIWHKVTCSDGFPVVNIIDLFESNLRQIITYIVLILVITVFILTVLYYRHRQKVHVYCFSSRWKVLRWLVSHPDCDDSDKLYDAFIIYSQEDEMFVVNHLVPYLEDTEDRKYKLCLHFRDWIPGEQILIQIGRSVRSSRRAIVVLSPNFLRSVWGVAEFRVAHAEALKDGTARVIVILYQDVSDDEVDEELKAYLQTNTYVRWGSPWFWKQLTYALPHPPDRERAALHYFSRDRRCQENLNSDDHHEMN